MNYEFPETVEAAVNALHAANGQGRVLAGGTDLLVQMRSGRLNPEHVVDVKRIPEMCSVSVSDAGLRIGAAVSGAALGEREDVIAHWPGVVEAFELIGSTQIQGRATLGGNLCNGSPAADSVPAMIAAGAVANIAGPNGRRTAPVEEIMTGPGRTSLEPGELIVDFSFAPRASRSGDAYLRFIPRTEMDIAVVGAGVCVTLDENGVCTHARVSLGAVAPTPLLVSEAADALIGTPIDDAALAKAAAAASAAANPIDDKRGTISYRIKVSGVLTKRAAAIARDRAKEHA